MPVHSPALSAAHAVLALAFAGVRRAASWRASSSARRRLRRTCARDRVRSISKARRTSSGELARLPGVAHGGAACAASGTPLRDSLPRGATSVGMVYGPELVAVLERSRDLGFLGPGPVDKHIDHAIGFVRAVQDVTGRLVDLGSGGGIPGLVLATARPDLEVVLVDAMAKRCDFLTAAIATLGLAHAQVAHGRAEELGRGELRGSASAVVARSFGPPAVTAECAAPLLRPGGVLVVSEPPGAADRWDGDGLAAVGLRLDHRTATMPSLQVLVQVAACPGRFPRRNGMPGKRPLF